MADLNLVTQINFTTSQSTTVNFADATLGALNVVAELSADGSSFDFMVGVHSHLKAPLFHWRVTGECTYNPTR
jgi:hypothetical protein